MNVDILRMYNIDTVGQHLSGILGLIATGAECDVTKVPENAGTKMYTGEYFFKCVTENTFNYFIKFMSNKF